MCCAPSILYQHISLMSCVFLRFAGEAVAGTVEVRYVTHRHGRTHANAEQPF